MHNSSSKKRTIGLNEIENSFGQDALELIIECLRKGELEAKAYTVRLSPYPKELGRIDNKKRPAAVDDWKECVLTKTNDDGCYVLVNSETELAFSEITLTRSHVHRILDLVGQAGGVPPKLGPKLYAFLAALWGHNKIDGTTCPRELFLRLEELEVVWDARGSIGGLRGIPAVKEFLTELDTFDKDIEEGKLVFDTSFANEADM